MAASKHSKEEPRSTEKPVLAQVVALRAALPQEIGESSAERLLDAGGRLERVCEALRRAPARIEASVLGQAIPARPRFPTPTGSSPSR